MTRRYVVSGQVQGVGFRWFVLRHAGRLGLTGHVRNLPDGRVEVLATGPADRQAELESVLRSGPDHARVDGVEVTEQPEASGGASRFEVR